MLKRIVYSCILLLLLSGWSHAQAWLQYRDSAEIFRQQKNTDSAIKYFTLSKETIDKDSLVTDSHIQLLTNIANLYYNGKSQYLKAEPFYLEAKDLIVKKYGTESDMYAANANFLGQIYYFLKQFNKSEEFYTEAKQVWGRLHGIKSRECATICNALGILYNDNGQFEKAEAQHLEARAIREKIFTKEHGAYAQSCNNLAAIYWNLGQYDKAEPLALEAKEIRGRVTGIPKHAYAISCVNLANIYRDMGKYQRAELLYIEARKVREVYFTKEHDDYALSCDILADLYYFMKQYEKAEPLYQEAKDIRERISSKKNYFYAQSCSNMAALYRETGQFTKAEQLALEADSIWRNMGTMVNSDIAINYNSLGALYFAMSKYDKAEQFFFKAREMWRQSLGEAHPFYTDNTLSLAKVYWGKNDVEKANDLFIKAFESQIKQAGRIFSFTSEDEKQLYLKNITGSEAVYQSFYFDKLKNGNKGQPYLISLLKRNQILSSSQQLRKQIYTSGDTSLVKKYDTWIRVKKQIAALYSKGEAAPQEHLKALTENADLLEKDIVRYSIGSQHAQEKVVEWKAIQQQLMPGEAAIEFIEFNYFNGRKFTDSIIYAALVLRKEYPEPVYIMLCEKKQLDARLAVRGINSQETVNGVYSSNFLFKLIWDPIEKYLSGIKKIYFAPAGILHRISFAGIVTNSNLYLGDKYQLVQLLTTASVTDKTNEILSATTKIILYGDISYNADTVSLRKATSVYHVDLSITRSIAGDFAGEYDPVFFEVLPNSGREIDNIASAAAENGYLVIRHKGVEANEESVKSLSGEPSPLILHIATHGFFYPDPEVTTRYTREISGKVFKRSDNPLFRSGLIMAGAENVWGGKPVDGVDDGVLTAYEISNMYFPKAKLVTLSACETALGDIKGSEGVYGLQRAFKMVGVENLVMSLWKVPDVETAEFMEAFYRNMFNDKAIDKAFYKAQNQMRVKYRNDPYKWAAWILIK
jgi:CHAT domain-containing protein